MGAAKAIAKEILYPYLEQDVAFEKVSLGFWDTFIKGLLLYEQDPKSVFATIYSLKLKDPERIIQELPKISDAFLNDLAEQYVLGNALDTIREFQLVKNIYFQERLLFLRDLKNAITSVERESMIKEMPAAYAAVSEEISDDTIRKIILKKERENLKEKFSLWDEEIIAEEVEEFSNLVSFSTNSMMESSKTEMEEVPVHKTLKQSKSASSYLWILGIVALVLAIFIFWLLFR